MYSGFQVVSVCPCHWGGRAASSRRALIAKMDWWVVWVCCLHVWPSHAACLFAALLYKPVDRVTRSTLVLHVSHNPLGLLTLGLLASAVLGLTLCQFCPPTSHFLLHAFIEDAEMTYPCVQGLTEGWSGARSRRSRCPGCSRRSAVREGVSHPTWKGLCGHIK